MDGLTRPAAGPMSAFPMPEPWTAAVAGGELGGGRWPAARPGSPVAVVAHSLGAHHRWWVKVAATLDGTVDLVVPDRRGRGRSSALVATGVAGAADDLVVAIGAERGDVPVVVVGHGVGAAVAALAAERLAAEGDARPVAGLAVSPPRTPAEVGQEADAVTARLGASYAHRRDDLAWWRDRPGLAGGLDRAARWAAEGDLRGHGFGWTVAGSADAVRAEAAEVAALLASGAPPPWCGPAWSVVADGCPATHLLTDEIANRVAAAIGEAAAAGTDG